MGKFAKNLLLAPELLDLSIKVKGARSIEEKVVLGQELSDLMYKCGFPGIEIKKRLVNLGFSGPRAVIILCKTRSKSAVDIPGQTQLIH